MIVGIEEIMVANRIRKDFGNIEELAEDIKENGLINPPVVNKEYHLLAGERRLRACKLLGWERIEVRMMDTRDAEHELNVEISENENRKEFSKAERVDYMKRLMRIEQAKSRQGERTDLVDETSDKHLSEVNRANERVAEQFGVSRETMRKEFSIVDHQDALTPEDFANWDEGKLSTNKAYQAIKKALAEKEERIAELESESDLPSVKESFYKNRIENLGATNEDLKTKLVALEQSEFELKQQIGELEGQIGEMSKANEKTCDYAQIDYGKMLLTDLTALNEKYKSFVDVCSIVKRWVKKI